MASPYLFRFAQTCIFVPPNITPLSKPIFQLKRPGAGNTAIVLYYYCSDGKLKYYTGESINAANWPDNVNKGTRAILNKITTNIEQLETDFKIKGEALTCDILRSHLDITLRRGSGPDVLERFQSILGKIKSGQILSGQKRVYTPGSIKALNFTLSLLKRFGLKDVSMKTYFDFIRYCTALNYSINYTGSQIKNIKMFCNKAGISLDKEFKKMTEETHDIYLDESELKKIYKLKLSSRKDLVRDWFILDCYTGLRVSDLVLLSKQNLSKGMISIANKKTGAKVVVPVHDYVKKIVKKYKGFPPVITDVEINRVIKGVAEKAGIKDDILVTITKGGKREDSYLKKWQMVSCHTARRSYITNLRKNGIPDSIVMKLTGIKSPMTLRKYDKLSNEEAAKIAAGHVFFKKKRPATRYA